ncbi:MAG: hypothetical protein ABIH75_01295 [Candidatus Omnitrophota bacterium]
MRNDRGIKSFVFLSGSGCLLPALIIFNLFFGWIFLSPVHWLVIEGVLILIFIINGFIMMRKIISTSSRSEGAIDVEGEVVEDKHKLRHQ